MEIASCLELNKSFVNYFHILKSKEKEDPTDLGAAAIRCVNVSSALTHRTAAENNKTSPKSVAQLYYI